MIVTFLSVEGVVKAIEQHVIQKKKKIYVLLKLIMNYVIDFQARSPYTLDGTLLKLQGHKDDARFFPILLDAAGGTSGRDGSVCVTSGTEAIGDQNL